MTKSVSKMVCAHHGTNFVEENHGTHIMTYCVACRGKKETNEISRIFDRSQQQVIEGVNKILNV